MDDDFDFTAHAIEVDERIQAETAEIDEVFGKDWLTWGRTEFLTAARRQRLLTEALEYAQGVLVGDKPPVAWAAGDGSPGFITASAKNQGDWMAKHFTIPLYKGPERRRG